MWLGKKWTHGIERLPQGKDVDSVAICTQRHCRFSRPPQTPPFHPKTCAAPQISLTRRQCTQCVQKESVANCIRYRYSSLCKPRQLRPAVCIYLGRSGCVFQHGRIHLWMHLPELPVCHRVTHFSRSLVYRYSSQCVTRRPRPAVLYSPGSIGMHLTRWPHPLIEASV